MALDSSLSVQPPAIEVINLTKVFSIHHRGSLKQALLGVMRRRRIEAFTALDNVSFTIPHGQTVAIIGRNGSGKSTMLGILARVYRPTSGRVILRNQEGGAARLAPLLELGAGFHPELTGLENIGFYSALLGMTRRQMEGRTDKIIQFAELENKIDTPLYGWNDGARLRLGFAIAVNIDPDILLVDEVLAVGDEAFQNKCYRLIADLQTQGKTIVFVSHDMAAVERIAERVVWLNKGMVAMDGDVSTVLRAYKAESASP